MTFRPSATAGDVEFGELQIRDDHPLFIIEYQHRWHGLRYAMDELEADYLTAFTVPVIIVEDMTRYEEIVQFYVINSKQKRISNDLALSLIHTLAPQAAEDELANLVGPGNRFRIRATSLTFKVAARHSGPWVGRIAQPHDVGQAGTAIRLKSFVDSLSLVLSKRNACSHLDDDTLVDTIIDYWEGIRQLMPQAFQNPKDSQIQRTVGVFALHILFARDVYPQCLAVGDSSPDAVAKIMQPATAEYLNPGFWSTRGRASVYVGSSGYRELARLIREKL